MNLFGNGMNADAIRKFKSILDANDNNKLKEKLSNINKEDIINVLKQNNISGFNEKDIDNFIKNVNVNDLKNFLENNSKR